MFFFVQIILSGPMKSRFGFPFDVCDDPGQLDADADADDARSNVVVDDAPSKITSAELLWS